MLQYWYQETSILDIYTLPHWFSIQPSSELLYLWDQQLYLITQKFPTSFALIATLSFLPFNRRKFNSWTILFILYLEPAYNTNWYTPLQLPVGHEFVHLDDFTQFVSRAILWSDSIYSPPTSSWTQHHSATLKPLQRYPKVFTRQNIKDYIQFQLTVVELFYI